MKFTKHIPDRAIGGDRVSMLRLSDYYKGDRSQFLKEEAVADYWLRVAAEGGDETALIQYYQTCCDRYGDPPSFDEFAVYLNRSFNIEESLLTLPIPEIPIDQHDTNRLKEVMLSWLLCSAEKGVVEAQYVLGVYELPFPTGVEYVHNSHRSPWLKKAAKSGHVLAQHTWGWFLCSEDPGRYDYVAGLDFLKAASDQGHVESQNLYAQYMEVDRHGECARLAESLKYYKKAAENLHPSAYYRLAIIHYHGLHRDRVSLEQSYRWWARGNALSEALKKEYPTYDKVKKEYTAPNPPSHDPIWT